MDKSPMVKIRPKGFANRTRGKLAIARRETLASSLTRSVAPAYTSRGVFSPLRPHATLLVASSLLLVLMAAPRADGGCNARCRQDLAVCMATQCAGVDRVACRRRCKPAAIRTLAYVLSKCEETKGSWVGRQELRIRRGDRDPVTVVNFGPSAPISDPLGFCRSYAFTGFGSESVVGFPLQHLGVSPDGSAVVFEANDESPFFRAISLSSEENGIFFVRSDGTGLRRLGPPSRDPSFRVGSAFGQYPVDLGQIFTFSPPISFSPSGRRIAFTDLGPGAAGEEAVQIVVLDLESDQRMQVTHLPSGTPFSPTTCQPPVASPYFLTCCPKFIDDETVIFQTSTDPDGSNPGHDPSAFTVGIDGSGLQRVSAPVVPPNAHLVPTFGLAGLGTNLIRFAFPEIPPKNPPNDIPCFQTDFPVTEAAVQQGKNLLQLTKFDRVDTFIGFLSASRARAFFLASADPLGMNPQGNCQLFSVDTLGRGLRQVTHFDIELPHHIPGCFCPSCGIGYGYYRVVVQDPVTKAIVFNTGQNPLRLGNPYDDQIFAMGPDGNGLRQLTDAAGTTLTPDGVGVESPGPFAYSAEIR
jgi:hypothetical protein